MSNLVHAMVSGTFPPMLRTLSSLLDKGAAHAAAEKSDAAALVEARLAPDMFPLSLQVRLACVHARDCAALLTGGTPPQFEGKDESMPAMKTRIAETVSYVESVPAAAFEGAAKRDIKHTLQNGLSLEMNGLQFLRDWALPHFYFHIVTAYDILRHNGVVIGKRDYLSHIGYAIRQAA
jgi:hypothetical protein